MVTGKSFLVPIRKVHKFKKISQILTPDEKFSLLNAGKNDRKFRVDMSNVWKN